MGETHGRVVHFEIPTDDAERAQSFYQDVFGWQIMTMPLMDYTVVTTVPSGDSGPAELGAINGGMMARSGVYTAPIITISVDDIDDALAEVERHGGQTVAGRQMVGTMGFTGYFRDPEGNIIGLWQTA